MKKGYYIHNQIKDDSGVSKKIDAQIMALSKNFEMHEAIIGNRKENYVSRKIRMKLLKRRPKLEYKTCLERLEQPDFVYIRKQILDADFYDFLCGVKSKFPSCKVMMEVPTYPYWNEFPDNELGRKLIEEEKEVIPKLKEVLDAVVVVGHEKELFGIQTIQINNGVDVDSIVINQKSAATLEINLIAVAKWREAHGYERIIDSLSRYYENGGEREIVFHMVGDGEESSKYKNLVEKYKLDNNVIFYGFKTGVELDQIYNKADLGLGFFAQYTTGGDYVSPLKSCEYLAKGLPVVTAVEEDCLQGEGKKYSLVFPDDDTDIDMQDVVDFYDKIYAGKDFEAVHKTIREYAVQTVSMNKVMEPVVGELRSYEKNN